MEIPANLTRAAGTPYKDATRSPCPPVTIVRPATGMGVAPVPVMATSNDVLAQLRAEHTYMKSLFAELGRELNADRARGLFRTLYEELRAHGEAEASVFYASLGRREETADLVRRALAAHEQIDELADELVTTSPGEPPWREMMRCLEHALEAHADEIERQLFPLARRVLGGDQLSLMAGQMHEAAAHWREAECAGRHRPPHPSATNESSATSLWR